MDNHYIASLESVLGGISMLVQIKGQANDISMIMLSSVRYALGRRTYIVDWTCDFVIHNIDLVSEKDRAVMLTDITDYKKRYGNIGDKCDEESWERLKAVLEQKLNKCKQSIDE